MVAIGKKTLNSRCFVQSYEVRARNLNAVKSGCTAPTTRETWTWNSEATADAGADVGPWHGCDG